MECTHLDTLIFSNSWEEYNQEEQKWIFKESQNQDVNNKINVIQADTLPKQINQLILAGDWYNRFDIQDYSFLKDLKQLKTLDLSDNQIKTTLFSKI